VHDPELLLLDEPAAGLDPAQRARFRDILTELPQSQPIVVSTHQVDDLNELFDNVVVLVNGVIRFNGSVADFFGQIDGDPTLRQAEQAYAALIDVEV